MIKRAVTGSLAGGVVALAAASAASAQPLQPVTPDDCSALARAAVNDGRVTSATRVEPPPAPAAAPTPGPGAAGPAQAQAAPAVAKLAYCRVQVTLKPEPGSNIQIELWLPDKAKWNGKFLGTGNGGAAGRIVTSALIAGLNRGYAVANTDMGSSGGKGGLNFGFGIGRPDLQKDFNIRSTDGMTIVGKALTAAYYGQKPKYSYFQGCSSGGAQAWEQIQHLPDAYNGVIAGAPANQRPNLHMVRIWNEWNNLRTPEATVSKYQMELLQQLATSQCDKLDGVRDGIIADPRECFVDLKPMLCKRGAAGPDCLTPIQVETVKAIWKGPVNPRTKTRVYWGFEPGSEAAIDLHWEAKLSTDGQVIVADNMINWSDQYQKAHPDGVGFDFDKDVTRAGQDLIDANWTDPRLEAFKRAGGKVIIYHGWADGLVPPAATVAYFEQIEKANGGHEETGKFARLYMIPGMGHCRGGVGTDDFDMLTALEKWVETVDAPDFVPAFRPARDGLPALSRPLCPYPSRAVYSGEGDTREGANFICGMSGGAGAWSDH